MRTPPGGDAAATARENIADCTQAQQKAPRAAASAAEHQHGRRTRRGRRPGTGGSCRCAASGGVCAAAGRVDGCWQGADNLRLFFSRALQRRSGRSARGDRLLIVERMRCGSRQTCDRWAFRVVLPRPLGPLWSGGFRRLGRRPRPERRLALGAAAAGLHRAHRGMDSDERLTVLMQACSDAAPAGGMLAQCACNQRAFGRIACVAHRSGACESRASRTESGGDPRRMF